MTKKELKEQIYQITYRGEIEVFIEASSAEEALSKAIDSKKWRFIIEGHSEFFETYDEAGFNVMELK